MLVTVKSSQALSVRQSANGGIQLTFRLPPGIPDTAKAKLIYATSTKEPIFVFADMCLRQPFGDQQRPILGIWPAPYQPSVELKHPSDCFASFCIEHVSGQPMQLLDSDFIIVFSIE